jgi:hypothetical protein
MGEERKTIAGVDYPRGWLEVKDGRVKCRYLLFDWEVCEKLKAGTSLVLDQEDQVWLSRDELLNAIKSIRGDMEHTLAAVEADLGIDVAKENAETVIYLCDRLLGKQKEPT